MSAVDLDHFCPEEVVSLAGIAELSTNELFRILEEGYSTILLKYWDITSNNNVAAGLSEYYALGKKYAPAAYALYMRFVEKGKEPRLPVHLCVNLHKSSGAEPRTVIYWTHPDAITGLYEVLREDRYYADAD